MTLHLQPENRAVHDKQLWHDIIATVPRKRKVIKNKRHGKIANYKQLCLRWSARIFSRCFMSANATPAAPSPRQQVSP